MKEKELPKIRVVLRNDRKLNANGKHTLNFYIRFLGKTIKKPTGIYISPKNWDKKKKIVIGSTAELKKYQIELSEKMAEFDRYFLQLSMSRKDAVLSIKAIHDFFEDLKFDDFCAYYMKIAQEKKKSKSSSTYNKYINALRTFKEFCKSVKINEIRFADVTPRLIKDFDLYMIYIKGLHSTSVETGYHQKLRYVFGRAVIEDIITKSPYQGLIKEESAPNAPRIPLTEEEVGRIEELEFDENSRHLERIRDYFLFYCFTGVRFGELFLIKKENLRRDSFKHYDQKNKRTVTKPLTWKARKLIHKYAPENEGEFCFRPLSNGHYNRELKRIAELADIDKNLISHLGRHTLATNLRKHGVPIEDIGAILCQKDPKTPLTYAKPNNENLLGYMTELFGRENSKASTSSLLINP